MTIKRLLSSFTVVITWLVILLICAVLGLGASICRGNEWYIEPSGGIVYPNCAPLKYHGMPGTVEYKSGYSTGLEAGRYITDWLRVGVCYDFTSYQDKGMTLQTPYGPMFTPDHSHENAQTAMLNLRLYGPTWYGLRPYAQMGIGEQFDGETNTALDARIGLSKQLFNSYALNIDVSRRYIQGCNIPDSHINITEPNQTRLTLCLTKHF